MTKLPMGIVLPKGSVAILWSDGPTESTPKPPADNLDCGGHLFEFPLTYSNAAMERVGVVEWSEAWLKKASVNGSVRGVVMYRNVAKESWPHNLAHEISHWLLRDCGLDASEEQADAVADCILAVVNDKSMSHYLVRGGAA